ncbi:unnamed protein product [Symbiodinium natans]|uniref:Glycosyltransferase 2-like domain-containing protein n=1 Tax=Symbiodinium natans TaxID=878477 RepID=A0A812TF67_9DINO|nr:unnamed protein product [Symbiodinium natans]
MAGGSLSGRNQSGEWVTCSKCALRPSYTPAFGATGSFRSAGPIPEDAPKVIKDLGPHNITETEAREHLTTKDAGLAGAEESLQRRLSENQKLREVSIRTRGKDLLVQEAEKATVTKMPVRPSEASSNTKQPDADEGRRVRSYTSADLKSREVRLSSQSTPLEKALYYQSAGQWDPEALRRLRREPPESGCRVSVVTPTTSRRSKFHPQLWECFAAQSWRDKELVVLETHQGRARPSEFFHSLGCENVVYVSLEGDCSIGCKRNLGIFLASGQVIVNFDDDDIYGPGYISSMVQVLQRKNLVALTLSAWYDFDTRLNRCGFVDPEALTDLDLAATNVSAMAKTELQRLRRSGVEGAVYGYGFSYVHLREPALQHPYPDTKMCEDVNFMLQLRDAFGPRVGLHRDVEGVCLHVMHGGNTADSMLHRAVSAQEMAKLNVCKLASVATLAKKVQKELERPGRFFVHASTAEAMQQFQANVEQDVRFTVRCLAKGMSLKDLHQETELEATW